MLLWAAIFFLFCVCFDIFPSSMKTPNFSVHRENQGHHDHESYYGERDTESLVAVCYALPGYRFFVLF